MVDELGHGLADTDLLLLEVTDGDPEARADRDGHGDADAEPVTHSVANNDAVRLALTLAAPGDAVPVGQPVGLREALTLGLGQLLEEALRDALPVAQREASTEPVALPLALVVVVLVVAALRDTDSVGVLLPQSVGDREGDMDDVVVVDTHCDTDDDDDVERDGVAVPDPHALLSGV